MSTRIGGSEFRLDASCAKLASWTNNNGLLVNRNEFMLKTLVYDEDLTRSPDSNDRHVSANREEDDTTEQTRIVGGSREIRIHQIGVR